MNTREVCVRFVHVYVVYERMYRWCTWYSERKLMINECTIVSFSLVRTDVSNLCTILHCVFTHTVVHN